MAEYVMKHLVREAGLEDQFQIASAATSELGNPVYPPARKKLAEHGISCSGHMARQLQNRDYDEYDLLIGMDQANLRNMNRICGGDFAEKIHLLLDFTDRPGEVADPWYTGDFELRTVPARWPTPGILGISRPPGAISWTVAGAFWNA